MMRSLALSVILCLFLAASTSAQDAPKFEFFTGYSFGRMNSTITTPTNGSGGSPEGIQAVKVEYQIGPPGGIPSDFHANLNGWNLSFAGNFSSWFGVVADFGGHYGTPQFLGTDVTTRVHSFLFGPRLSVRKHERITPFVHALFGGAHWKATVAGVSDSDQGFAMAFGGGIDVKLTEQVHVRIVQADYLRTNLFDEHQNNFRYSGGLVFRFGK